MRTETIDGAKYQMLSQLIADAAFGQVPVSVLQMLVESAGIHASLKGDVIYEAGERWDRLGFVIEGSIAMLASGGEAKEHLYEHTYPGQFFGVSAMFDGGAEMAKTVVVSRQALHALFERAAVLEWCKQHGTLATAFAITLARRVRSTTALLAAQMNHSASERIARYLLKFAGEPGLSPVLEPLPQMTQSQIGAAAGTVKDVAARTIGAFERQGALKRERGRIRWINRELMEELAASTG